MKKFIRFDYGDGKKRLIFNDIITEELTSFYANLENKEKGYNLVLITDEELNKLEKKSKE